MDVQLSILWEEFMPGIYVVFKAMSLDAFI